MRALHSKPLEVDGILMNVRLAGVANGFDSEATPDLKAFIKNVSSALMDQTFRVRNIQALM